MPTYKLQYFDGRGVVEPVRILFALARQEYEDARFPIVFGTPGDFSTLDRTQFEEAKASGALDANLGRAPVLYVDDASIGQSKTILRFLARQLNLFGDDELAIAKADSMMECVADFKEAFGKAAPPMMGPDPRSDEDAAKAMEDYWTGEKGLDKLLARFEGLLGDGPFVFGDKATVADVVIFSFFRDNPRLQGCAQYGAVMQNCPKLTALCDAFGQLESIAKWLSERPQTMF